MKSLEDSQDPAEVRMYVNGPLFEHGIPMHVMIASLKDFQAILDKTYLGLVGRKRITKDEREKFYLRSRGVEHHSLETWVEIVMVGSQVLMPFYSHIGPKGIWDVTKQTWEMIKQIMPHLKSTGQKPSFSFGEIDNSQVTVITGNQTNNYYGPVYNVARAALPLYQDLAEKIESDKIDDIRFGDRSGDPIRLSRGESDFLLLPSSISDESVSLECEIFGFDKHENKGKLSVFSDSDIPIGEYRFSVIGDQDIVPYVEAMLRQIVKVVALVEFIPDPFEDRKIKALQIIKIIT